MLYVSLGCPELLHIGPDVHSCRFIDTCLAMSCCYNTEESIISGIHQFFVRYECSGIVTIGVNDWSHTFVVVNQGNVSKLESVCVGGGVFISQLRHTL